MFWDNSGLEQLISAPALLMSSPGMSSAVSTFVVVSVRV